MEKMKTIIKFIKEFLMALFADITDVNYHSLEKWKVFSIIFKVNILLRSKQSKDFFLALCKPVYEYV